MNNQYKNKNCEKLLIMLIIINPIDKGFINKEQKEEEKRGEKQGRKEKKIMITVGQDKTIERKEKGGEKKKRKRMKEYEKGCEKRTRRMTIKIFK